MDQTTGMLLKRLRTEQQLSLPQLATRAGVTRMTLSRWEAERFQPRLPELKAVLNALNASLEEREEILRTVNAPRAVRQFREAIGEQWIEDAGTLPARGDLLKTLRQRRGLSQEQVAERIGVHRSTVTYWEQSRATPPADRWETLLNLLGATPDERETLCQSLLLLSDPATENNLTQEGFEAELESLRRDIQGSEQLLLDLRFLHLEARLWSQVRQHPALFVLLVDAYRLHSRWLWWQARHSEANACVQKALRLLESPEMPRVPLAMHTDLVHIATGLIADRLTPSALRRALQQLHDWLPLATTPETQVMLYRDMADYFLRSERVGTAIEVIQHARELSYRAENPSLATMTQFTHAVVLTKAGRVDEAMSLLRTEDLGVPIQNMHEAFQWCRAFAAIGERDAAKQWLCRAREIIEEGGLTAYRTSIPELAKLLTA